MLRLADRPLAGRDCGDCSMCCYLLGVAALDKPRAVWCGHCPTRRGCAIYDARPDECRAFDCHWLLSEEVPEAWKPSRSKLVVVGNAAGDRITVHVDPKRPDAWRRAPYHATLRAWAGRAAARQGQVIVTVGDRSHIVFPTHDKDLGRVGDDQEIVTTREDTPRGPVFDAYLRRRAG